MKLTTRDYRWGVNPTKDVIQKDAPKNAVCAILHGAVWGWTKSYEVEYYDEDVIMEELSFMSEPVNKYQICKRKKFILKPSKNG